MLHPLGQQKIGYAAKSLMSDSFCGDSPNELSHRSVSHATKYMFILRNKGFSLYLFLPIFYLFCLEF